MQVKNVVSEYALTSLVICWCKKQCCFCPATFHSQRSTYLATTRLQHELVQFEGTNERLTSFKHANFHLGWQNNQTHPVAAQHVESGEWGEAEGQDSPSLQQASAICLNIACCAKDNWYMVTEPLQFCGETDISAHLCISVAHTMTATPFSTQVQQQFIGLQTGRILEGIQHPTALNILYTSAGTILPGEEQATNIQRNSPTNGPSDLKIRLYTAIPSTQHVVESLFNSTWWIMVVSRQHVWQHVD